MGTMSQDEIPNAEVPNENELLRYADRTRRSLIARLENWEDQKTWEEFYRTYWRLIYAVATKAGLRQDEAWDVVQETILSIAKQSKKQMYNPEHGSFKVWLWNVTRWRINDQFRKRKKDTALAFSEDLADEKEEWINRIPDEKSQTFESLWESEWKKNLLSAALERVKNKVSPRQYQIFDLYVIKDTSATAVAKNLGVSMTQVYLSKHRVGRLVKKELELLMKETEH